MNNKLIRKDALCRLCSSGNVETIIRLNDTPLEDQFVDEAHKHNEQKSFPLELAICRDCGYVYLPHIISPEVSYIDYLYKSSTTSGLGSHYDQYAKDIVDRYSVHKKSLIVDLGSNDGSMLASFKKQEMNVVGVEPATLIADCANQSGITTINDFFSNEVVSEIVKDYGQAEVITANYMFANVDDVVGFTNSVESLLSDSGIFIIETGYHPEQFRIKMFDYIYHEHFSYFTVGVLAGFLSKCGLEVIDVEKTKPKGGSIRVISQSCNGKRVVKPSVKEMIANEVVNGVYNVNTYSVFSDSIQKIKKELITLLSSIKNEGASIVGLGASHSTTTLIYHFELHNFFEYIVDDNKIKQGLYSPGNHIPVHSTSKMYSDKPDYVLILAWQHQDSILKRHKKFVKNGGKFIVPLPVIRVID
jgi:hypothetical protein